MAQATRAAALIAALVVCVSTVAALTASSPQAPAQTGLLTSDQDIDARLSEASRLLLGGQVDDALAAFQGALEAARRLALESQQASALCGLGESLFAKTKYADARESELQCLEIYQRLSIARGVGRAQFLLGLAAELSGALPEAEMRTRRAIDTFESAGDLAGRGRATVVLLRVTRMDVPERDRLLARTVADAEAAGDRFGQASALHLWGDERFARGQYEDALDALERAATIYEGIGARGSLGTVFNSLGRLYRVHGQLGEALRYQQQALTLHESFGNSAELMQSLNAVAVVRGLLGQLNESTALYERALAIAEQSSSIRLQDFLRANIAASLSDRGEFGRAASTLEEVIAHGVDSYPSVRHAQLSWARLHLGQPREALAAAERALELCGTVATDCITALSRRAAARAAAGDRRSAIADISEALARIEAMRTQLVPADFFKQEFHHVRERIYGDAIALNLADHEEVRALETAELARSRAFLDLLAARAAMPSDALVSRGPARLPGADSLQSVVAAPPAAIGDIVASARRMHSTFLMYWVVADEVVAWVVTADGHVQAHRTKVLRSRLDELIRATSPRPETTGSGRARQGNAWRELYDLLILPVRAALPKAPGSLVTIVPHGPLHRLSFAALQDTRGRYLLEDYAIHYAPAASIFRFTSAMQSPAARAGNLLLVADPLLPPRSRLDRSLSRLPGARTEVDAIARLVPSARTTVLTGALATESSVRAAAVGKSVLHFATHAILRDDDPFGSFLALGTVPGQGDVDGSLTAQEVYGWSLRANLVVLSACQSGGGRVTGDGIATFARAFIYAGTPSLIASVWDVADAPGDRLLPAFYRAWFAGQSKARALRVAQLELLRDLRAGNVQIQTAAGLVTLPEDPVLWAGFALIGEPE